MDDEQRTRLRGLIDKTHSQVAQARERALHAYRDLPEYFWPIPEVHEDCEWLTITLMSLLDRDDMMSSLRYRGLLIAGPHGQPLPLTITVSSGRWEYHWAVMFSTCFIADPRLRMLHTSLLNFKRFVTGENPVDLTVGEGSNRDPIGIVV